MEEMDAMDLINEMMNEPISPPPADPELSPDPQSPVPMHSSASSGLETSVAILERMPNPVIERARSREDFPPERLPSSTIVCGTCPLASWVRSGDTLKAHCSKWFLVMWSSDTPDGIEDCSTREEALLQLQ